MDGFGRLCRTRDPSWFHSDSALTARSVGPDARRPSAPRPRGSAGPPRGRARRGNRARPRHPLHAGQRAPRVWRQRRARAGRRGRAALAGRRRARRRRHRLLRRPGHLPRARVVPRWRGHHHRRHRRVRGGPAHAVGRRADQPVGADRAGARSGGAPAVRRRDAHEPPRLDGDRAGLRAGGAPRLRHDRDLRGRRPQLRSVQPAPQLCRDALLHGGLQLLQLAGPGPHHHRVAARHPALPAGGSGAGARRRAVRLQHRRGIHPARQPRRHPGLVVGRQGLASAGPARRRARRAAIRIVW